MDTSNRTRKLLTVILNRVFDLYNIQKYRKYFIELNLNIGHLTSKHIIFSDVGNKYSSNMYYHYYIYLIITPDLMKKEMPDLLEE